METKKAEHKLGFFVWIYDRVLFGGGDFLLGDGFYDFAGAKAAGAYFDPAGALVSLRADLLEVGAQNAFGLVVCVTYVVSYRGAFPANFTYPGHLYILSKWSLAVGERDIYHNR